MKPLSLSSINALSPYEVQMAVSPSVYRFITDYEVEILISFDSDDLLGSREAYMFNISNINGQKSPRDIKVRNTIISIINNFFEENEVALLYICETCDSKQAMRNRLFESWFAYANESERFMIMVANVHDLEDVDNYAAIILRKDNPHFVDYVTEFNRTVNLLRIKPE